MDLKHLQLNTTVMNSPEQIARFIIDNNFDTACLQEICYPIDTQNELKKLLEAEGYVYEEGLHFKYLPKMQNLGVAIVSKYPIIDTVRIYWNTDDYQPKNISNEDFLGKEIIEDDVKTEEFPASRGIKHSAKSRCIMSSLVQTPEGIMRLVTTHFTVSDLCTETTQMYDLASLTTSFIQNSTSYPTIFSGDLNIRAQSYSVAKLREALTCHTAELKDTLSDTHVAKEKDFPNGLAIDHVFSKDIEFKKISTEEILFSSHKAVIAEFELN